MASAARRRDALRFHNAAFLSNSRCGCQGLAFEHICAAAVAQEQHLLKIVFVEVSCSATVIVDEHLIYCLVLTTADFASLTEKSPNVAIRVLAAIGCELIGRNLPRCPLDGKKVLGV
jgi:hypothetical protein